MVGALDLGTTGVRFFLFDLRARPIASAYRELPLSFPRPGWVEQDPGAMLEGALSVIREALEKAGLSSADLLGFGLTNQRETVVLWERDTGKPLGPAIVWQDRRTAERCQALRASPSAEEIRAKTGLLPDPYFSATKLEWLFSQDPGLRRRAEKRGNPRGNCRFLAPFCFVRRPRYRSHQCFPHPPFPHPKPFLGPKPLRTLRCSQKRSSRDAAEPFPLWSH